MVLSPLQTLQRKPTTDAYIMWWYSFWGQGQWQFKAGSFPSGPYVDLGMDDLRSGISLVTRTQGKKLQQCLWCIRKLRERLDRNRIPKVFFKCIPGSR